MMEQDPLNKLLQTYAAEPLPAGKGPRDSDVWREIERRRHRQTWLSSWRESWRAILMEPQLSLAAMALAVAVGAAPTVLREHPRIENILAQRSLHLDVFSANSTALRASFLRTPSHALISR